MKKVDQTRMIKLTQKLVMCMDCNYRMEPEFIQTKDAILYFFHCKNCGMIYQAQELFPKEFED